MLHELAQAPVVQGGLIDEVGSEDPVLYLIRHLSKTVMVVVADGFTDDHRKNKVLIVRPVGGVADDAPIPEKVVVEFVEGEAHRVATEGQVLLRIQGRREDHAQGECRGRCMARPGPRDGPQVGTDASARLLQRSEEGRPLSPKRKELA